MSSQQPQENGVAFYNSDGLVPAWNMAAKCAGKEGRIATLPDIIRARMHSPLGTPAWETYFTTNSAEYFGIGKKGRPIIIVAHGIGPMSTWDGAMKAYSYQFKDKTRSRRGGRISQKEFLDLEDGKFGEVGTVDFAKYQRMYQYPFREHLTRVDCYLDPLAKIRLGNDAKKYFDRHAAFATQWHAEQGHGNVEDPFILQMGIDSNCYYHPNQLDGTVALGHLLSCGRLTQSYLSGENYPRHASLVNDVSCHGWNDGTRLVAVTTKGELTGIKDFTTGDLLRTHWKSLFRPVQGTVERSFFVLEELDTGVWFTQCEKKGESLDTGEAEFRVTSMEPIGEPTGFKTTVGGHPVFLKYGINEAAAIAPPGANAYAICGEPQIVDDQKYHWVPVQFYKVTVDTSQRLVRDKELENDFDTVNRLLNA